MSNISRRMYRRPDRRLQDLKTNVTTIPLTGITGDMGNAVVKVVSAFGEVDFPHALTRVPQHELDALDGRGDDAANLFFVNGIPYRIRHRASKSGEGAYKIGAQRYTAEYYGVLAAIGAWLTTPDDEGSHDMYYFGSHPPRDDFYRRNIAEAVIGTHAVSSQGITKTFTIHQAACFDEPVGAFNNAVMTNSVSPRMVRDSFLGDPSKTMLVVDPGGFTLDMIIVERNQPDYTSARSFEVGILDALTKFESLIRRNNAEVFMQVTRRNDARIRQAFKTGVYDAGALGSLDVRKEAANIGVEVMDEIMNTINSVYGGIGGYHGFLFCNGGSAALETHIRRRIPSNALAFSNDIENIHMSTAYGGVKRMALLNSKGVL